MRTHRSLQPLIFPLAFVLLAAGWIVFALLNREPLQVASAGFREWFWRLRGLDLAAQAALVLSGALGIAAILPAGDDDDSG